MLLRLHSYLPLSHANGPGCRAVIWVQGCSLRCKGCFNPSTHSFNAGYEKPVQELAQIVAKEQHLLEGITLSGGEPLDQLEAITELLRLVKRTTDLSTVVFTGYEWIEWMPEPHDICCKPVTILTGGEMHPHNRYFKCDLTTELPEPLRYIDVLIAGRFDARFYAPKSGFQLGNKEIHFLTDRYSPNDFIKTPPAELIIDNQGRTLSTGTDPFFRKTTTPTPPTYGA